MESEFPSNTNRPKASPSDEKRVEKITTGEVIQRKKPLSRRFAETFNVTDSKSVVEYVLIDVALPALKDLIADMVSQGIERKLFGSVRSSGRRGGFRPNTGYTAYNRMSSSPLTEVIRAGVRDDSRGSRRESRSRPKFNEIICETRVEAQEVIQQLFNVLERYHVVSVADLNALVGVTGTYIDERWGWTDLRGSDVHYIRNEGYLLVLPPPEALAD